MWASEELPPWQNVLDNVSAQRVLLFPSSKSTAFQPEHSVGLRPHGDSGETRNTYFSTVVPCRDYDMTHAATFELTTTFFALGQLLLSLCLPILSKVLRSLSKVLRSPSKALR